jgi:hypothetical protein
MRVSLTIQPIAQYIVWNRQLQADRRSVQCKPRQTEHDPPNAASAHVRLRPAVSPIFARNHLMAKDNEYTIEYYEQACQQEYIHGVHHPLRSTDSIVPQAEIENKGQIN